jgi:hypothetical protein
MINKLENLKDREYVGSDLSETFRNKDLTKRITKQEVLGRKNRLLSLIRHGPH